MRLILGVILLTLAAASVVCGQSNIEAARAELNAGAREYREGNFPAAEEHFRRALELDPTQKNAPLFIARAIQQQYKPGVQTPENIAVGERAVAAYEDVLAKDAQNEGAYNAILYLYGQMKNDEKVEEMLTQRANDYSTPGEKRAAALVILASRRWQCSYDITERKENKRAEEVQHKFVVKYTMPADSGDFYKAQECADEGLQLAEQAVALDQNNANAWAQEANLLREKSKLAEMSGDAKAGADYKRQSAEALATYKKLIDEAKASAAGATEQPEPSKTGHLSTTPVPLQGAPEMPKHVIVEGGVLNGKAVSKPQPSYPPDAKAARVQGVVMVRITINEGGKVIEAEAVSGQPLLRDAAVAAAREARFNPTRLSGQPVKVSGYLTYNFVLE